RTPIAVTPDAETRPGVARLGIVPPCDVNPEVPRELSHLIVRLLAEAPSQRPASAGEVAVCLAEFGERLQASASGRSQVHLTATTPQGRRRAIQWVAVGLTLLLLTTVLFHALRQPDADQVGDDPFEAWLRQVADFDDEEKVKAVAEKLRELNPAFDGQVS